MTPNEFFDKYNGKGIDFDGNFGNQCVDVAMQFSKDVLGIGKWGSGNAVGRFTNYPADQFDRFEYMPGMVPQLGDVMIWGTELGQYGHIAVCKEATATDFTSFDQNWPVQVDANGNGFGVAHFQHHNYHGLLGWLRPKHLPNTPAMSNEIDQVVANKLFEFKRDGEDTVRQIFDIPGQSFYENTLKNDWANLRTIPADWPLDPALWANERNHLMPQVNDLNTALAALQVKLDTSIQSEQNARDNFEKLSTDLALAKTKIAGLVDQIADIKSKKIDVVTSPNATMALQANDLISIVLRFIRKFF